MLVWSAKKISRDIFYARPVKGSDGEIVLGCECVECTKETKNLRRLG
jgi:hypothetical protein